MNDDAFRRMAKEYVRQSGEEHRRELQELPPRITPELDRRVYGKVKNIKRRRYAGITGLVAACLLLVLLAPSVLNLNQKAEAPSLDAPSNGAPDFEVSDSVAPVYEVIPLSFTLPEEFSVVSVEQDIEKTVYLLDNTLQDDVVMTLEYGGDASLFDGLTRLSINGRDAFCDANNDYALLAFENQDVLYVLTCKHDINTLVDLSKSIL